MKNRKKSNCSKIPIVCYTLSILTMIMTLTFGGICKSLTPMCLLIGAIIFYIALMVFIFTIFYLNLKEDTKKHITSKKILEHFDTL